MSVYFITARELNRVKIGYAANPQERTHVCRVHCPVHLELERTCEGGKVEESALHERFAGYRVRGEWFEISAEIEAHMETLPRYEWRHRGCQHAVRRAAAAKDAA